jgi:hypothetical protein
MASFDLIPLDAREQIEKLFRYTQTHPLMPQDQFEGEREKILEEHDLLPALFDLYWEMLKKVWGSGLHVAATVYAIDQAPVTFDFRLYPECLPHSAVPIAFIAQGQALFADELYFGSPSRLRDFREKLVEAMMRLGEINAEDKARRLLEAGVVEIERYEGVDS